MSHTKILEAIEILRSLGLPTAQQNERSALCLLALLSITPDKEWNEANSRLIGITPIMEFAAETYGKQYAPNSRETFRRFSMHQFVDAGIALYNPDDVKRPVNSPKAVYMISPDSLHLIRSYGTPMWEISLEEYLQTKPRLIDTYAKERKLNKIPVLLNEETTLYFSAGAHSELIRDIIEEFGPRFAPGSELVYAGDTGEKNAYFNTKLLLKLGVEVNMHGKMPDVILYYGDRDWLLLIESVTSHGPVDGKRHEELKTLFSQSKAGLVYVTAFPNKSVMARYLPVIAWETEVWVADAPTHLIHFNGDRFLGPHPEM